MIIVASVKDSEDIYYYPDDITTSEARQEVWDLYDFYDEVVIKGLPQHIIPERILKEGNINVTIERMD